MSNDIFLNLFGISFEEYEEVRPQTKHEVIFSLTNDERKELLNTFLEGYRNKYKKMKDLEFELRMYKFDIKNIMLSLGVTQHIFSNDGVTILSKFITRNKLVGFSPEIFKWITKEGFDYTLKVLDNNKIYEEQKPFILIKEIHPNRGLNDLKIVYKGSD